MCPGFKSLHRHHPILKKFRKWLRGSGLADGGRILLAVSGGGDSVGLLGLFLSARPRPDLELGVAHVHHNLRGEEADRDLRAVRDLARGLGLPFASSRLRSRPPRGESVEAWARAGRYAALERLRVRGGWDLVATAHSLDDQAETVLLRIARGTGLQGLAGILPRSGRVVRPALGLTGEELREAARGCGLPYLEDSTNADRRFLRNRVRREVLPAAEAALPGFSRRLAALARLAAEAAGGASPKGPPVAVLEADGLYYECAALAEWSDGEGLAALREGIRSARGDLRGLTERHLRALWALRTCRPGAVVPLPGGWEGSRRERRIRIGPRREP
ncbi:MAG: tRNA lysidine(34) synthetase TilS [Acidobacteriota bacterium]